MEERTLPRMDLKGKILGLVAQCQKAVDDIIDISTLIQHLKLGRQHIHL